MSLPFTEEKSFFLKVMFNRCVILPIVAVLNRNTNFLIE